MLDGVVYDHDGKPIEGAEIILEEGYIIARAKKLKGAEIHFEIPSVGATANIAMTAIMAEGKTKITNAAVEPHIVQLCEVLNQMGGHIEGVGTSELTIIAVSYTHLTLPTKA